MIILSYIKFDTDEAAEIEKYGDLHYTGKDTRSIPFDIIEKAEILFGYPDIIYKDASVNFKSLKWIQLPLDGYDRVNMDLLSEKGIKVSNANGVYGIAMAEDIFSKIFIFTREIIFFINNMHEKKWLKNNDLMELKDKNMVILGTGDIGTETAFRAKAFGMNVAGYNKSGRRPGSFDVSTNDRNTLLGWLPECDFLVSALPLTKETYHFINEEMLEKLSKKCLLVNVSRGKIIDEKALINALKNRKIKGAALDVFEKEPLSNNSELWELDNAYITPHVSWVSDGWMKRLKELFIYNLRYYPDYNKMKHIIRA